MKCSIGIVFAVTLLADASNSPVPNRAPLAPNVFYALPLGTVKPAGWLKEQLRIQADGLSGHLDEFWPDVGSNSAWLGGTGEGWERGPYYVDGLLPLAYLLDDPVLVAKARKWVDYTLDHQRPDGDIGPEKNFGKDTADWWPKMIMLKALTQFEEVTGDPRVIPVLEKFFAYQATQLAANPLHEWAQYRWGDEILSIVWLYNRNGNPKLLDLAREIAGQGFDWKSLYADFPFKDKVEKKDATLKSHGVNNAMALKTGAVWSLISGEAEDREFSRKMLTTLDGYHGLPNGTFAADEHLAGKDPSQGTELCTVVEEMFSLEELIQIYGDANLATKLERIAFNALPGAFSKDMWAHQYDEQPNQVLASDAKRDWTTNGNQANIFGLEPNFGCCTANMHQGWPKFAASLWMGTADHGLATIAYSPSEVRTVVNGTAVHITEDTASPFDENVTIKVDPASPVTFPLKLRIPAWTSSVSIRVNGAGQRNIHPGQYLTITREWHAGDTVLMRMPMPVVVSHGYRNSVFVSRGPLLYALDIGEKWKRLNDKGKSSNWEVDPTTPWNFALVVSATNPQASFTVQVGKMGSQPFSPEGTPVALSAKALRIGEWKMVDSSAGPLPLSPLKLGGSPQPVRLIPYGAAKLRITEFPEVLTK
ncbi:MAG TPA: beta-L-arabinofuranosidase domain-containing protein [Bryobacteraceae bacterium]|nr:beta-L-arabinofuranosidase domain-containing protein [Bryobacteraceae bacterium]